MEPQPVNLATPKFLCFPARPLVSFCAVVSVMRGIAFIISEQDWLPRIPQFLFVILNVLILYGAAQNNEFALRWALRVVIVNLVLVALQFLIWPVCYSSYTASGIGNYSLLHSRPNGTSSETYFVSGMLVGYLLELGLAVLIGGEYFLFL